MAVSSAGEPDNDPNDPPLLVLMSLGLASTQHEEGKPKHSVGN